MEAATHPSTAAVEDRYLLSLQVLNAEIEGAMRAIAANDLPRFQESVARQEDLTSSLTVLGTALNQVATLPSALLVAGRELNLTNLKYAALLKHSGKTVAMLSALCSSHTNQTAEIRSTRSKHQTWSCEM